MIPGRVVAGDFCRTCPYADHDGEAPRRAAPPSPDDVPHPDTGVEEFAACCLRGGTNHFPAGWQFWEVAQLAHRRLLDDAARRLTTYPGGFAGRGVVIAAGGQTYFPCAYVCVSVLRWLGCTLPVEFWHLGPDEIDEDMARAAAALGVTCRDAWGVSPRPRRLGGWELKPFSVIHSRFREVLYLDADNLPVRDPTDLFDAGPYRECGAVFWPDLPAALTSNAFVPTLAWDVAGVAWRDGRAFESGQFLVDKARCWRELLLTMHLNAHSDFWYQYIYGDKDTFKLAWHKLDRRYAMPEAEAGWKSPAICQHDFAGQLLFTHACKGKEQLRRGVRIGALPQADAAVKAAERLRAVWTPVGDRTVWNPRAPAVRALAEQTPCLHRGAVLRTRRVNGAAVNVHRCALHGSCTVREGAGVRACVGCEDYLVRKAAGPRRVVRVGGLNPGLPTFNGSAIEFQGRVILAYRVRKADAEVWVCELDDAWRASRSRRLDLPRGVSNRLGCEDPRLFIHGGRLHLAYCGVEPADAGFATNVLYCGLDDDLRVAEHFHPRYDRRAAKEKNWQFFEHAGELHAVYSIAPHVVLRVRGNEAREAFRCDWPVLWKGGLLRGGAAPVLHGGEYYGFFHGVRAGAGLPVYTLGCYTFEARPPFRPSRVTQLPLLSPDRADRSGEGVPDCVFPCGAFLRGGRWCVSYGYYDHEVWVAEFDAPDLEDSLVPLPRQPAPGELLSGAGE